MRTGQGKASMLLLALAIIALAAFFLLWSGVPKHTSAPSVALAASEPFAAAQYLQASPGGMAQYGYAMQQSSSSSATLQALSNWNGYINPRSQWSLSGTLLTRLALADWNARQTGPPQVTPQQLADAATRLINARLASMTAQQQADGFKRMMVEVTPKGALGINPDNPYISATRQSDGRWTVTVSPEMFSKRKAVLSKLAPGMLSASTNFYPGEAILVCYSVASDDLGFGGDFEPKVKKVLTDATGLDMTNRSLYGENGYLFRRPLNTSLTDGAVSLFLSDLGF
ncbi:MAG: hypothetical protein ACRD5I_06850 [Candidatus Acidiferrales bacterium]